MQDSDSFVIAVNNYRATTQLLMAADIFAPGDAMPQLLEMDVRGDVGGIRELLGEYIQTVKGGVIEPHVNNNWKILGNNWNAASHDKAVTLLREGKLTLSENQDTRTLPKRTSPPSNLLFREKVGKKLFTVYHTLSGSPTLPRGRYAPAHS